MDIIEIIHFPPTAPELPRTSQNFTGCQRMVWVFAELHRASPNSSRASPNFIVLSFFKQKPCAFPRPPPSCPELHRISPDDKEFCVFPRTGQYKCLCGVFCSSSFWKIQVLSNSRKDRHAICGRRPGWDLFPSE